MVGKVSRCAAMFVILAMVVLASGCAGATPTKGSSSGAAEAPAEAAAPKPLDLAIGETADYDGVKVTVVSTGKGPKTYDEKATFEVEVKYENGSTDTASFDEYSWKLEDSAGARANDTAILAGDAKSLGSGELAPGGSKSGKIYFTQTEDIAKIVYEFNMFSGEEGLATWVVK